jgi:hypothetical protein
MKKCKNGRVGSAGEVKVKNILEEMEIEYMYNTSHKVRSKKSLLCWDFIITDWDGRGENDDYLFIEYDGKQHFEPATFGGMSKEKAEEAFKKTQQYDKIKNDFCEENNLLLLRIPYTQYENVGALIADFMRTHTNWGFEKNI